MEISQTKGVDRGWLTSAYFISSLVANMLIERSSERTKWSGPGLEIGLDINKSEAGVYIGMDNVIWMKAGIVWSESNIEPISERSLECL